MDLSFHRISYLRKFGKNYWLTVTSFSRSRDGKVDGAKCSFLRTHCLIIWSLSRTEVTLDSGEPDEVEGTELLYTLSTGINYNV